jgi:hypothetical protein
MPAGMDINPYAMKKAKGNKDTMVRLKSKPVMMSGMIGPMMLERNEMTKKVNKMMNTM